MTFFSRTLRLLEPLISYFDSREKTKKQKTKNEKRKIEKTKKHKNRIKQKNANPKPENRSSRVVREFWGSLVGTYF